MNFSSKSLNLRVALRISHTDPSCMSSSLLAPCSWEQQEYHETYIISALQPLTWNRPSVMCSLLYSTLWNSLSAGGGLMSSYSLHHTLLRHLWTMIKGILCCSCFIIFKFLMWKFEPATKFTLISFRMPPSLSYIKDLSLLCSNKFSYQLLITNTRNN